MRYQRGIREEKLGHKLRWIDEGSFAKDYRGIPNRWQVTNCKELASDN